MERAIACVNSKSMSVRSAAKDFGVPRTTLQDRLCGRHGPGEKPGPTPKLSYDQERKIVDYACNRASLGIGFGKKQFTEYSRRYAEKHKVVGDKL